MLDTARYITFQSTRYRHGVDTFDRNRPVKTTAPARRTIALYAPREFIGAWSSRIDTFEARLPAAQGGTVTRRDWAFAIAYFGLLAGGALLFACATHLFP